MSPSTWVISPAEPAGEITWLTDGWFLHPFLVFAILGDRQAGRDWYIVASDVIRNYCRLDLANIDFCNVILVSLCQLRNCRVSVHAQLLSCRERERGRERERERERERGRERKREKERKGVYVREKSL